MSTLKVNALRHNSASSDGVTLHSDGTAVMQVNGGMNFRNRIINGDMRIDQRNAGAAVTVGTVAAGTYGVDRWWGYSGTGSLWQVDQVSTSNTDFPFATRIQRIAGQTSTSAIYWGQIIEYNNMFDMAGQSVTLSFYATAGSNFSGTNVQMYVYSGTAADQGATSLNTAAWTGLAVALNGASAGLFVPTTTRQRFTFTFTLGAGIKELCVRLNWSGSGTAGANDYIDITGVQLEVGSVATPFERRPYGTELALCQRYYWEVSGVGGAITGCTIDGLYANSAGAGVFYSFMHPVTMRTAPTATVNYNDLTNASSVVVTTSIYGANVGASGGTTSSGRTQFNFNSTGFVKMSAEL